MKKAPLLRGLAFMALFASATAAQAVTIVIDNFDEDQGVTVSDTTVNSTPVTNTNNMLNPANVIGGSRTISSNLLASVPPVSNSVDVVSGVLDITNGGGEDSEVILSWLLGSNLLPVTATNVSFSLTVLQSDANPTNVEFLLGMTSFGLFNIPGNTTSTTVDFSLSAPQIALFNTGGTLRMVLNGAPGWDATFDSLTVTEVPVPSSLLLLSTGLLVPLVLRRKGRNA